MAKLTSGVVAGHTATLGGHLVLDGSDAEVVIKPILTAAGTLVLANVQTTSSTKESFIEVSDLPEPEHVEETAEAPNGAPTFDKRTLTIQKLSIIIPASEEIREDAKEDPLVLLNPAMESRFALRADAHLLGKSRGANLTDPMFDSTLAVGGPYDSVSLSDYTAEDKLRRSVSAAQSLIEEKGYNPNGVLLATDFRGHIRDARRGTTGGAETDLVYSSEAQAVNDLRLAYSANLNKASSAPGAGKVVGVVADWNQVRVRIRKSLEARISEEATITIGGQQVNLFERGMVAVRYDMRLGAVVTDDDAVCLITNE